MTARIVFRISIVALLLYLAVTQKCPASGRSESSIIGWMLRGHVYDTLLAELPFTCVFKCRDHLFEHVLSKTRTARINGLCLISVLDLFSCECCS